MGRFYARSASDKTDDWPYWFVADEMQSNLNVTQILRDLRGDKKPDICGMSLLRASFALQPFLSAWDAVQLAVWANKTLGNTPRALWSERVAAWL